MLKFFGSNEINKDENDHRFALSTIRGRERKREKEKKVD